MAAQPEKIRMSIEEYLELDQSSSDVRYEYIDGYVYMMSGGTPQHALIIGNFQGELNRRLEQRGSPCLAYPADATVQLSETRYVHPDVVATCHEEDLASTNVLRFPRLVVEVLSPSTERKDRNQKFDWYRACPSIQEVVLVRTEHPLIEVYRRRVDEGQWLLHIYGPGEEIELMSMNVLLPVDIIYKRVIFPENGE